MDKQPTARPLKAPKTYPFPKDFESLLSWPWAEKRLMDARNYWLMSVGETGRPHATPVWGVWLDLSLFVDGHPGATWVRNLLARAETVVHLESADEVVIVEGVAKDYETVEEDLSTRIIEAWNAKYGRLAPNPAAHGILRIIPRSARGWTTSTLTDGTGWDFD